MSGQAGFSAAELLVVVAVIGILMLISVPFIISVVRTSAVRAGAEEFATVLGQARQLAIKDNRSVCVNNDGTTVQYWVPKTGAPVACDGLPRELWIGTGTDAAGNIRLANNIAVSSATTVTFTYMGLANAPVFPVVFTVTHPQGGALNVNVATSGRITIGP
jgi:prepilin-type N-terminal cleavage/methylation domain-containing protein